MKAVGYHQALPIDHPESLLDLQLPAPAPGPRDLLVRVRAVSVNPVDTKVRRSVPAEPAAAKVLGWDAVGEVRAVGSEVRRFRVGDRVWYAGSLARAGSNAELHAVDERIVGLAPRSVDDVTAAALPLTSITAWELLFDRLGVARGGGHGQALLVMGGAGGVGSALTQIARQLTGLRVIATASRPETRAWCLEMGAHDVVDHSQPLAAQLQALGVAEVDYAASLTQTDRHFDALVDLLKPQGKLAVIDDPKSIDATKLKRKSLALVWESMFTRPVFGTPDMHRQGELLDEVARLVDAGTLRSTARTVLGPISVTELKKAHALIESAGTIGKIVLPGYAD
ncbi:MAG: zinc-binding alcohol dehydrogenase family protein [Pseudomonadota bacterium]